VVELVELEEKLEVLGEVGVRVGEGAAMHCTPFKNVSSPVVPMLSATGTP